MNGKQLKSLSGFVAAAAVLLLSLSLVYYYIVRVPPGMKAPIVEGESAPGVEAKATPEDSATMTLKLKRTEVSHLVEGDISWELNAAGVETGTGGGRSVLHDASGRFFDKNGRILSFDAPLAVYEPENKSISVTGPFTGTLSPDNSSLIASRLLWSEGKNELAAEEAKVSLNNIKASSEKLSLNPASGTINFDGNVNIEIPMEKE